MASPLFEIEALEVRAVEGPDILHGVDLTIGAVKSTLLWTKWVGQVNARYNARGLARI